VVLFRIVSEIFNVKNIATFKSRSMATMGLSHMFVVSNLAYGLQELNKTYLLKGQSR